VDIHVEFLGPMRRPWPERERDVEIDSGWTVGELMTHLGYREDESRFFSVVVNGSRARGDVALTDGDRVTLTVVVGGG
jgi:sulfur carrier protein ThiS